MRKVVKPYCNMTDTELIMAMLVQLYKEGQYSDITEAPFVEAVDRISNSFPE